MVQPTAQTPVFPSLSLFLPPDDNDCEKTLRHPRSLTGATPYKQSFTPPTPSLLSSTPTLLPTPICLVLAFFHGYKSFLHTHTLSTIAAHCYNVSARSFARRRPTLAPSLAALPLPRRLPIRPASVFD